MKFILTLFVAVACSVAQVRIPGPGGVGGASASPCSTGGWSLIFHTIANNSPSPYNSISTSAIRTTGANLLIIQFVTYPNWNGGGASITDTYGNTWTIAGTSYGASGGPYITTAYSTPTTTGSGDVVTVSSVSSLYISLEAMAFSGAAASSPLDTQNGNNSGASSVTSLQTGTVTPGANGDLLVSAVNMNQGGTATTYSVGSSFSLLDSANAIGGVSYGFASACLIQTTAAGINPAWSSTTSGPMTAGIYAFKP